MQLPPELAAKVLEIAGQQAPAAEASKRPKQEPSKKRPKYNARKTVIDGITFDSKKEAERYSVLKLLERSGQITELKLQVLYRLVVNDILVCKYVADFVYYDGDAWVVEDCKGFKTREYILKRKLMKAVYGIVIKEV